METCQSDNPVVESGNPVGPYIFENATIQFLIAKNMGILIFSFVVLILWKICEDLQIWQPCCQIWQPCCLIWQPCWSDVFENIPIRFLVPKNMGIQIFSFVVLILWEICGDLQIWQPCCQIWQPCWSDIFENATIQFLVPKNMGIQIFSFLVFILW